ncbi:rhodanese-like domain-containing protein [Rhodoferax sp.]|uniref:rhodanese-like domain-containing protein n=1 Tax=Rhodoferax sp. TaxID=50421 RepID=UPI00283DDFD7|nr:rhodanese-like domain-containing protein [Rhodoferax sp.]MDR3367672.1 rhodanese-like domain-containing protein [Rhodoferax sp.]
MKQIFLCVVFTFMSFANYAMKIEVHGSTIYASGPVENDFETFQKALEQPGIDKVAFVNSPGGDLWTGMNVGRLIAQRGIHTVIAGSCVSACSIMFMGGKERSFSDAFRPALTYIGIHGAHNTSTNAVDPRLQPQIYAFYKQNMAERFNATVMNTALYDMEDAGAMLKVFDAARTPKRPPYHCRSVQSLRKDCTEFKDLDALSLGIVTTNTLTPLDLPDGYKEVPKILGQEPNQALPDPVAYFETISAKQCSADTCRKLLTNFVEGKEHKALAIPVDAPGLGTAINRDTANNAFVGAVYACNHLKNKPARLCETQTVDGYDVRELYATGVASHTQALARLTAPSEKFYANEEFGGGFTTAHGLRTQNVHDMTPQSLDGIKTINTQELALALMSSQPPVLIDVWAGVNDAIPSAVTLLNGGLAYDDPATDSSYEERFYGLLKLLSPDPAKPVVFYCMSRDCWLSVNASLRAKKVGYSQVIWYRGGMESWKAANLPLARVIVRAVVR